MQEDGFRVEETWSFVLDGVAKSITCTLLGDDDARQCNNTGTLPSLFSFSSLGARRYYRASRDTPEFLVRISRWYDVRRTALMGQLSAAPVGGGC